MLPEQKCKRQASYKPFDLPAGYADAVAAQACGSNQPVFDLGSSPLYEMEPIPNVPWVIKKQN